MSLGSPILAGNHYELKVFCVAGDQLAINVLHYKCQSIVGAMGVLDAAGLAGLVFGPDYAPLLHNDASFYGTSVQDISALPYLLPGQDASNPLTGTGGATPLPDQVSGIITIQTAFTGRKNRGRVYVPFPPQQLSAVQANPIPLSGYVSRLSTLGIDLLNLSLNDGLGNIATMHLEIHHRVLHALGSWTDAQAVRPNFKWATQRRRGDYGRANGLPF